MSANVDLQVGDLAGADLIAAGDLSSQDLASSDLSACTPSSCDPGFTCCGGTCVNTANDIHNCGGCGVVCQGPYPFCDGTQCTQAPCPNNLSCLIGFCCGSTCCQPNQICCVVNHGGPVAMPTCYDPAQSGGTCPVGCPTCN